MADAQKLKLNRKQLSDFLGNDYDAIKQFEQLFAIGDSIAPDVVQEVSLTAEAALFQSAKRRNHVELDYIDFNLNPPHTAKRGRLAWNPVDDTLNLHHANDVTLQVGIEEYSRATNRTGVTIANGTFVGLSGVGMGGPVGCEPYKADGLSPSLYVLGVATQDILPGQTGFITVRGLIHDLNTTGAPYGETWAVGDVLYSSPSVAGALTNIKPTAPNLVIPVALVIEVNATQGIIACRPTIFLQLYYGAFYSSSTQTAALVNTPYAVTYNNTVASSGVALGTPTSRIVISNSGLYEFTFSIQASKSSASAGYLWAWLRKNGSDVANSAMRIAVQGTTGENVISRTLPLSMQAGDYVELMWAVDSTATSLKADAATAFCPAAPSSTMAVAQLNQ